MSAHRMLLLSPKRVAFHPDFLAEVFATWRARWSSLTNEKEVVRRVIEFTDEGLDIPVARVAALDQIRMEVVYCVTDLIWHEYRVAMVARGKTDGTQSPPDIALKPSL